MIDTILSNGCHNLVGCVVRKYVLPEGLAKELREMIKLQNVWMSSFVQWFHNFPHATPDAFEHMPDLFARLFN